MSIIRLACLSIVILWLLPGRAGAQGRAEFNGPFESWANVRARFGAKGDGRSDDTKALQRAIDGLGNEAQGNKNGTPLYKVVYLPAGTYCISSTLVLKGKIGVSIIGEDPGRTIIKWIGGDHDTLLWANGSAYFKVSRITWDANGRKKMEGIGIHWKERWNDGLTRSYAALNIELSDNRFINGFMFGIAGGTDKGVDGTGANDSEVSIRRCLFDHCTMSGIEIKGYNALDYWIWDCKFLGCMSGVQCAHGGYHVYRSFFSGSQVADLHNVQGYYNSVRGCYSENGWMFSADEAMSSNPFKRIFQDNTIIRPKQLPVQYFHLGKITLWGNRFTATQDTSNKWSVNTRSWAPGIYEVLSIDNTYPAKDAIRIASSPKKLYSIGDKQAVVPSSGREAFLKTMDVTPTVVRRKVFEVPAGADAGVIQSVVDRAAVLKGQRPVVHFAAGVYTIDKTIVIPAGADMQLLGDGLIYGSAILKKEGVTFPRGAMFLVKGPSYICIQDMQFGVDGMKGSVPSIVFEGVDQRGSQAHLDQVYSHADTSIILRDVDYLNVQKDNSFFTDGNYVSGGRLVQKGQGTAGLYCYGGQFEHVRVEKNGRFLARDCWWEGETRMPLDLQGSGTICIDGAMIAPNHSDSGIAIRIGRFNGHISLMNMYVQGALSPEKDNPGLDLLVWNIHFYHKMDVLGFLKRPCSYKGAFIGLNAQCFRGNDPACKGITSIEDKWVNIDDVNGFLEKETSFDRGSRPLLYGELPNGVSNIYISRVSLLGAGRNGMVFSAQ